MLECHNLTKDVNINEDKPILYKQDDINDREPLTKVNCEEGNRGSTMTNFSSTVASDKVSISSTLNAQSFRTNVVSAAFF